MEQKNINPESWTESELLRHLYREVIELKESLLSVKVTKREDHLKVEQLEQRVVIIETKLNNEIDTRHHLQKLTKDFLTIAIAVTTGISAIISTILLVIFNQG